MGRQDGMSTPIFDQLLREMTKTATPPAPAAPPPTPPAEASATEQLRPQRPTPRRRHRAD